MTSCRKSPSVWPPPFPLTLSVTHRESLPLLWYIALQGQEHVLSAWHVAEVQLILSWILNCSISVNYIILFSIFVPTKLGKGALIPSSWVCLSSGFPQHNPSRTLLWFLFWEQIALRFRALPALLLGFGLFLLFIPSLSHSEVNHYSVEVGTIPRLPSLFFLLS